MNWLQRLFGMDQARDARPVDPAAVVHVATLPLWQTPLIVKGLEQRNITATFAEMSSPKYTMVGIPTARIYVFQRDRAVAERIIAELTAGQPSSRRRRNAEGWDDSESSPSEDLGHERRAPDPPNPFA
jgi:hypothetical protein